MCVYIYSTIVHCIKKCIKKCIFMHFLYEKITNSCIKKCIKKCIKNCIKKCIKKAHKNTLFYAELHKKCINKCIFMHFCKKKVQKKVHIYAFLHKKEHNTSCLLYAHVGGVQCRNLPVQASAGGKLPAPSLTPPVFSEDGGTLMPGTCSLARAPGAWHLPS